MKINGREFGNLSNSQEKIMRILERWGLTPCLCNDDLISMIDEIIESQK